MINAIGAHSVYVPEVRHPVEVKAAEEHLVRWLTRRVGAPFVAPSLVEHGWKLMGGRLVPDSGLPAAQFMYEDAGGRRLTLYIRKETGLTNTSFRFAEREGFGAFYWIDRPLAYALAGRVRREELMGLANVVYAQLEALASSGSPASPPPAPPACRAQPLTSCAGRACGWVPHALALRQGRMSAAIGGPAMMWRRWRMAHGVRSHVALPMFGAPCSPTPMLQRFHVRSVSARRVPR